MSITIGGIICSRVPGYPQEDISRPSITVMDKLQCVWEERIKLAKILVGLVVGDTGYPPHKYDSGLEPLVGIYVKSVKIEPVIGLEPSSEPLGKYTKAQLTVTYGSLEYDLPEEEEVTYINESVEPAAEFLTLSTKGLYWGTGEDKKELIASEAPAIIVRMVDWVYTLYRIKTIPNWIWTYPGCVNDGNIISRRLNRIFAAGTLLCGNPALSKEVTSEGTRSWTITVRFTYRPEGWNKFPRVSEGGALSFETIYNSVGTPKVFYLPADFGVIVL